jgi:hypothetical protein
MFHNYLYGLVPLGTTEAYQILPSITRGDTYKIVPRPCTKDARCNSFFVRISRIYSQLAPTVRNNPPSIFGKILNNVDLSSFLTVKVTDFRDISFNT